MPAIRVGQWVTVNSRADPDYTITRAGSIGQVEEMGEEYAIVFWYWVPGDDRADYIPRYRRWSLPLEILDIRPAPSETEIMSWRSRIAELETLREWRIRSGQFDSPRSIETISDVIKRLHHRQPFYLACKKDLPSW